MGLYHRICAAAFALTSVASSANAFEFGYPGWAQKPGLTIGVPAARPPAGLYAFDTTFIYRADLVGPGAPAVGGASTDVTGNVTSVGLLWVPGWTVLGATYSATVIQPFISAELGPPIDFDAAGFHNTFVSPVELSWRLGDSGFFVNTSLGLYVPTGTIEGDNGLGNSGNPWWTLQPTVAVSYLADGWNLTANLFYEINTKNSRTDYRTGDILHAEFTATKTIGDWTIGPIGYYSGQVTDDRSSSFYGGAVNSDRYDLWAAGALVGYDFGPARLDVWALKEFSADVSGGTLAPIGDSASITEGWSVFLRLGVPLSPPVHRPERS